MSTIYPWQISASDFRYFGVTPDLELNLCPFSRLGTNYYGFPPPQVNTETTRVMMVQQVMWLLRKSHHYWVSRWRRSVAIFDSFIAHRRRCFLTILRENPRVVSHRTERTVFLLFIHYTYEYIEQHTTWLSSSKITRCVPLFQKKGTESNDFTRKSPLKLIESIVKIFEGHCCWGNNRVYLLYTASEMEIA